MEYEVVWVAYDSKPPHLPIGIAPTPGILADMMGVKVNTVWGAWSNFQSGRKRHTRYAKVLIEKD